MEGIHSSGDNISLDGEQQSYSPASLAIISLIMGIIIAVTIVGNFFVILAYILDPHVRANEGNLLILNLAVTDFMVGVFSLTFNLSWLVRGFWPHGEIICKLWLVLDYTVCWVSQITMVLISWDRYCLVSMGLKYKTYQTKKRVGLILVFVWTIMLILLSLLAFAWSPITGQANIDYDRVCIMEFIVLRYAPLAINLIPYAIMLVCIVTLNTSVYINIYQRSKVRQCGPAKVGMGHKTRNLDEGTNGSLSSASCEVLSSGPHERGEENIMNANVTPTETNSAEEGPLKVIDADKVRMTLIRHRKAAIVLSILTGCFILFWLPYIITTVVYSICAMECVSNVIWELTEVLAWCNSAINPFIYAATNVPFRKNFRRFLLLDRWSCGSKHCNGGVYRH